MIRGRGVIWIPHSTYEHQEMWHRGELCYYNNVLIMANNMGFPSKVAF